MIEIKFKFQEDALVSVFRGRRFLLEAIAGEPLMIADEPSCFHKVNQMNLSGKKDFWLGVLRTHRPTELVEFKGCAYFSNEWWVGKIKLESATASKTGDIFFLLTGWSNEFHGTSVAIVGSSIHEEVVDKWLSERLSGKIEKGYDVVAEEGGLSLVVSTVLPTIAGLPSPEDAFPEDDSKVSIPTPSFPRARVMPPVSIPEPVVVPDPPVVKDPFKVDVPKTEGVSKEKKKKDEKEKKKQRKKKKEEKAKEKINSIKELMASRKKESDW